MGPVEGFGTPAFQSVPHALQIDGGCLHPSAPGLAGVGWLIQVLVPWGLHAGGPWLHMHMGKRVHHDVFAFAGGS
jgi:hypothetical protein